MTVHATEGIYSNLAGEVINAQTCPFNWNQGAEIKINGETATIVDQTGAALIIKGRMKAA